MNPETEKNVNEAIDWLQKTGGSIQDFAVEQAPLYCREVVAWTIWFNGAWVVLAAIAAVVSVACLRSCHKRQWRDESIPSFLIGGVSGLFAFFAFATCVGPFIKAAVAPRLVIVEHLRSMK